MEPSADHLYDALGCQKFNFLRIFNGIGMAMAALALVIGSSSASPCVEVTVLIKCC